MVALVGPSLDLSCHLAPRTGVTAGHHAAVINARALDAVALSDGGAQTAGDAKAGAGIQNRQQEAPAMLGGRLALKTGEAPPGTAAGSHVSAAVTHSSAPGP